MLDRERCIMCYRCVRFHQEIPGDEALAAVERGADSEIGTLQGETYDSPFAGNTIELCPVGALTSRQYRFRARPWDLVRTPSVCTGCAVGCNVEVHSRTENGPAPGFARDNLAVDDGWLCDRGRFETLPTPPDERALRPMVRQNGRLAAATWDRRGQRGRHCSADRRGAGLGAGCRTRRSGCCERLRRAAAWPCGRRQAPGRSRAGSPICGRCKSIVLVGLDAWERVPVLALWIRRRSSTARN